LQYLEASKRVALATGRIVDSFDLVPQHYLVDGNCWSDHTIDEAGFGIKGLAAVYLATRETVYKDITRKYTEQFFDKMILEDGLWEKIWYRSTGQPGPRLFGTRSLGWSMEGLLSAHSAIPENPKYLEYAEKLASHFLASQHADGFWYFVFADPATGIGEKGTALWSMLLYRLYGYTQKQEYLTAARRALLWCIGDQYKGPDPEPVGALVSYNCRSGIIPYRNWCRMACSYASAFMGHALLAELNQR